MCRRVILCYCVIIYSGNSFTNVSNYPYVTLEHALDEIFLTLNYKSCLLIIGMNAVAVIMPFSNVFKVFDSHSWNLHGMTSVSGYCVLISVEGIENLTDHFRISVEGNTCNHAIPFELIWHSVSVKTTCKYKSNMKHHGSML